MPRQTRITPCRDRISDRFPVASFVVHVPRDRVFEIACATDPRLFHPDRLHQRTARNFLSSRYGGLLRAPAGEATYLVPPHQLKQFAGSTRLYYALGTYGSVTGEDPYFTIPPDDPDQIPCIQISQDFTGGALDRARFGRREPADAKYGAPATPLTWGGDAAVRAKPNVQPTVARGRGVDDQEYDDGFDKSLWTKPLARNAGSPRYGETAPAEQSAGAGGGLQSGETYADGGANPPSGSPPTSDDTYNEFEDGYSQESAADGGSPYDEEATSCTLAPVRGIEKCSEAFKSRVCEIAANIGTDADYLMSTMCFETGGTFSPSIKNAAGSGATGLIQFMPSTAKRLGTTVEALAAMTAEAQLDYVEKYYAPFKGRLNTIEDAYMAVLWPAAVGKPDDHVLFSAGTKTYDQNKGLDLDKDGKVTKAEAASRVAQILRTAQDKPAAAAPAATQASLYGGAGRSTSEAASGYEDGPDLARRRGPSSPVRYGGSAVAERSTRRTAPPPRRLSHAAGESTAPVLSDPAPDLDSEGDPTALPGRSSDYSDVWAPEPELPAEALRAAVLSAPQELTPADRLHVIDLVARFEGGPAGYSAINADGEFNTPSLAQYQNVHVGLSWGFVQFAQRYTLGEVLRACARRDPAEFANTFGDAAAELTRVTNAPTEEERLAPVAGAVLWEQPWLERFERAGTVPQFQAAQREVADNYFLVPDLPIAGWLGFNTDRALAMVFDRAVHMGRAAGLRWIVNTVGPIRSQKQRAAALAALGFADLASFAKSVGELSGFVDPAGHVTWGAPIHAALVGALRKLGAGSPISIPSLNDMLDTLVRTARDYAKGGDEFWTITARRLAALRTTTDLTDTPYQV